MVEIPQKLFNWRQLLVTFGPGLVVMLANTEVGSVITVAQSGAKWGYRLLLLQFLIIPLLYTVQELAARLALGTGIGYAELIHQNFTRGMTFVSITALVVSCFGSLVTQMVGMAGVGQLYGVPVWVSIFVLIAAILLMVGLGAYRSVERTVIAFGLFELGFLIMAWESHPDLGQLAAGLREMPLGNHDYLYLVAANLGTSVMPWAIFYQQSALIDKGLGIGHLKIARLDILIGAVLCQTLTAAVLIAAAATFGHYPQPVQLENVPQIVTAFSAAIGPIIGRLVFVVGLGGGALVATITVCLTAAWALGEVAGFHHSLEHQPLQAPWFYASFALILLAGGGLVASGVNLIRLSIAMGVVNALLLPVALGFLFQLARTKLAEPMRLKGVYAAAVGAIFFCAAATGVYAALAGIAG
ncbi:MAG: NRAMP family divalent metal transporter [Steroidobacteraceae bacterium]